MNFRKHTCLKSDQNNELAYPCTNGRISNLSMPGSHILDYTINQKTISKKRF